MNRLGNAVRTAVAAAVFVLPVVAAAAPITVPATVPVMDTTIEAGDPCCTGTPWGEIGQPPVAGDV
jgi:hypothetical protein